MTSGEYWGLVTMEFEEARQKVESFRGGVGSADETVAELIHLAAAAVLAATKIQSQKNEG